MMSLDVKNHVSPEQEQFNKTYIGAAEICERVGISRPALSAGKKRLPAPIIVPGSNAQLWMRADVEEMVNAWALIVKSRSGVNA